MVKDLKSVSEKERGCSFKKALLGESEIKSMNNIYFTSLFPQFPTEHTGRHADIEALRPGPSYRANDVFHSLILVI